MAFGKLMLNSINRGIKKDEKSPYYFKTKANLHVSPKFNASLNYKYYVNN